MKLEAAQEIRDLSLEEMVVELAEARAALKGQEQAVYYLERAVVEGMQERGATVVRVDGLEATLSTPVSYDYGILARLREITSPDDLVGYTPQRAVVSTEKEQWHMTQAKTLSRLSHDHASILADAKIYGNPKVRIATNKGAK